MPKKEKQGATSTPNAVPRADRTTRAGKDGFNLDFENESTTKKESASSPDASSGQAKKAGELASMFLETRKALQVDCNVMDPIHDNKEPYKGTEISRKTIMRAEKVKSMISVKYIYLERLYFISQHEVQHPGVEGVYNPLQIIRNRKISAKYNERPKPLSIKTLPLASNVFSKHNKDPKHPWKMLWAIELTEYLDDLSWQRSHWHELRNSKGKLWFPRSGSNSSGSSGEKQRLHDKIFAFDDESTKKSHSRRHSSSTSNSTDSDSHLLRISAARSPSKSRMKEKMKRKLHSVTSFSSNPEDDHEYEQDLETKALGSTTAQSTTSLSSPRDPLKEQLFKRVSRSPERYDDSFEASDPRSVAPRVLVTAPTKDMDVNEVAIKSILSEPFEAAPFNGEEPQEEPSHSENGQDIKVTACKVDVVDQELEQVFHNFRYFELDISSHMNYALHVYPHLTRTIENRLDHIFHHQLKDIFKVVMKISDEQFPVYDELYHAFSNEVTAIMHMIHDNYSIKIDNLLSASDRSLGEINTSLSLELRKVDERLDKLNSSLFSNNVVSETFKDTDLSRKIKTTNNYRMLYYCLENLIVVMLRLIWVIVNIYKVFEGALKLIWRVLRYVLF